MRTAPSFVLETRTSRGWQQGVRALCAATTAALLLWLAQGLRLDSLPPPTLLSLLAALAIVPAMVGLLVAAWRSGERRELSLGWDGAQWNWRQTPSADALPVNAQVCIDLGGWLLVRLATLGDRTRLRREIHWVALSEADLGPAWHGLRCALYSSRRMTAPATIPSPADLPATPGPAHPG